MMEPGNALIWTTHRPCRTEWIKSGHQASRGESSAAKAKAASDYLIDNFIPSSHVRRVRANLALVGELASI
jgi:hypothetical protein